MRVYAYFQDHKGNYLNAIDDTLPNGVSKVTVSSDRSNDMLSAWRNQGPLNDCYDCTTLTKMINQSLTKIEDIDVAGVDGNDEVSPAYLTMLVSIFNKANRLSIENLGWDEAYACFQASMVQQNGLRELEVNFDYISTLQAQLLYEGIALSTSLEKLTVVELFTGEVEVVTALVNALGRNHNLKHLGVVD
mmetsp:Transcript_10212/g.24405  ORF Transcript_10212/g.24405 Transcript_10212/m.24405 type:complete len:190 (+) Transcript_10212:226-795(+)